MRSGRAAFTSMYAGALPLRTFGVWMGVLTIISLLNTVRVLGAHEYDSTGAILSRDGQLGDSIDTPGGPWTELWAPVGLRYHALHHYFPGIPYHNLGAAYRRIIAIAAASRRVSRIDQPEPRTIASRPLRTKRRAMRGPLGDDALRDHQPAGLRTHPSVRGSWARADCARPPRHVSPDGRSRREDPRRKGLTSSRSGTNDHPRGSLPARWTQLGRLKGPAALRFTIRAVARDQRRWSAATRPRRSDAAGSTRCWSIRWSRPAAQSPTSRHSVRHGLQRARDQPRSHRAAAVYTMDVSIDTVGARPQCGRLRHFGLADAADHRGRGGLPRKWKLPALASPDDSFSKLAQICQMPTRVRLSARRAPGLLSLCRTAARSDEGGAVPVGSP